MSRARYLPWLDCDACKEPLGQPFWHEDDKLVYMFCFWCDALLCEPCARAAVAKHGVGWGDGGYVWDDIPGLGRGQPETDRCARCENTPVLPGQQYWNDPDPQPNCRSS